MKKTILWIALGLVFLVIFNMMFFMLGGAEHPASVWISYGFIHFAYLMLIATPILTRKSSRAAIFGVTLHAISSVYFAAACIVGVVFIFIRSESCKIPLLVQALVAGIYLILLLINMIANEHTADNIERQEAEISYIKTAASRVKLLMGKMSDKKANREIEKAYDLLHASPTKSIAEVRALESEVMNKIFELEDAVNADSDTKAIAAVDEILSLMNERNRKIKLEN